jgi:hypothetical protein
MAPVADDPLGAKSARCQEGLTTMTTRMIQLLAVAALASAGAARANPDWTGDQVHGVAEFPKAGNVYDDLGTFPAPYDGTLANHSGAVLIGYDVDGARISFSDIFSGAFVFSSAAFNGFTFSDASRDPDIVGVSLDAATTNPAVSAADATFNSDSVSFNFQGETWNPGQPAIFDIAFGAGVPEPGPWAVLLVGVGATGGALRRRTGLANRAAATGGAAYARPL